MAVLKLAKQHSARPQSTPATARPTASMYLNSSLGRCSIERLGPPNPSCPARVPLPKPYEGAERRREVVWSPKVDLVPPTPPDIAPGHPRNDGGPRRTIAIVSTDLFQSEFDRPVWKYGRKDLDDPHKILADDVSPVSLHSTGADRALH